MAFPVTPLDVTVELQLAGTWTDITDYVYVKDGISIRRGRSDEASRADPSQCEFTLNNRAGRFSPRNPTGPYYGQLTRNTPIRVAASLGSVRLVCPEYEYAYAPDTAGLSITGDIDLRFDGWLPTWAEDYSNNVINKALNAGQRGYRFGVYDGGRVYIVWSADGTNELFLASTVGLPQTAGRQAIRATLDVNNGAGGRTATFYYAPTIAGPWVQLGDPVTATGTTSIFNGTDQVRVDPPSNSGNGGTCYAAEIRDGIGGALAASPTFTAQTSGATSFVDAQGNTWSTGAGALITNKRYRFHGEVSAWPQSWDVSGKDVRTPIVAAGVLRRMVQGGDPLNGPIYRATVNDTSVHGYWPMEDQPGATSIASGSPAGRAMSIAGTTPDFASYDGVAASHPILTLRQTTLTGYAGGTVPAGVIHARCLTAVPTTADTNNAVLMRVFATGTAARWDIVYGNDGGLTLYAYDALHTQILAQGVGFRINGEQVFVSLDLVQNGANIDWKLYTRAVSDGAVLQFTGTLNSQTVGAVTAVQISPDRLLADTSIGHLTIASAVPTADVQSALRGYAGETAGRRIERLCGEEGFIFTAAGGLDQSVAMGAQRPISLYELISECEAADMGQVFESRDQLGLCYRTRDSRQYQNAALAVAYGDLSELTPVEDDQGTRNDVTVSRANGSSARATVDSGPLSTPAPPNGVGRYSDRVEINIQTDTSLADQAQWRVTAGTVDEARYPSIVVNLERPPFTASAAKTDQAVAVDHGDLITVTGLPAWMPPDTVEQHTIGQTETLEPFNYTVDYVCIPATPTGSTAIYDVRGRYLPTDSTLALALSSSATTMSVTTPGTRWVRTSTEPAEFPFNIKVGGEEMTVTAITGGGPVQTFTVTRSVNGVVKSHALDAPVSLSRAYVYAL